MLTEVFKPLVYMILGDVKAAILGSPTHKKDLQPSIRRTPSAATLGHEESRGSP